MQTIKIALASLHYHRRQFRPVLICCGILTMLLFALLLLWNTMIYFDHQITSLLQETVFYGKSDQVITTITSEAKDLDQHYLWLILLLATLVTVATFFFSWHLLVKRQIEYQTMRQVGTSWPKIALQLVLEIALPILLVTVLLGWLTLTFQSFFIQLIANIHSKGVELISPAPTENFSNGVQNAHNNWMLMIPDRFSLLLRNVSIDGKNWLLLVGKTFGQSLVCLFSSVAIGILLFLATAYRKIRSNAESMFKC